MVDVSPRIADLRFRVSSREVRPAGALSLLFPKVEAGTLHVVRGGKRLARTRHHLPAAQLTEADWRRRWEAGRWFLQADGESGKRFGNETVRVRFRQLISGMPTGRLRARLTSMADQTGIAIIAPAYTSHRRGAPTGRPR